eukprot:6352539-Amphidinium_carterae.2
MQRNFDARAGQRGPNMTPSEVTSIRRSNAWSGVKAGAASAAGSVARAGAAGGVVEMGLTAYEEGARLAPGLQQQTEAICCQLFQARFSLAALYSEEMSLNIGLGTWYAV